jgi:hypothetical protein
VDVVEGEVMNAREEQLELQRLMDEWIESIVLVPDDPVAKFDENQPRDERGRWADVTGTPEFKEWFGDSKVVAADGKPIRLYHGTKHDIEQFDVTRSIWGAVFLAESPKAAEQYMDEGVIMPVYARITNPKEMSWDEWFNMPLHAHTALVRGGKHDGIRIRRSESHGAGMYKDADVWLAFDGAQIKSAFNSAPTNAPHLMKFDENQPRDERGRWVRDALPPEPGTAPIPEGHVRLYHQTDASNIEAILREGLKLSAAKGIEGPRAIYADEQGFYGKPGQTPTIEFHVPREQWSKPFVVTDVVTPDSIVAAHLPWHRTARYLDKTPSSLAQVLDGSFDGINEDHDVAIAYLKRKHGITKFDEAQPRDERGRWTKVSDYAPRPDFGGRDHSTWTTEESAQFSEYMNREREYMSRMSRAIHAGTLSLEHALDLGWKTYGDQPKALPETLYHVTTNAPAVEAEGLKSRGELQQREGGLGLGGGPSDTISFAEDRRTAEQIHDAMLLTHDVMNDKVSLYELMRQAHRGEGATGSWAQEMYATYNADRNAPDNTLDALVDGVRRGWLPHDAQEDTPTGRLLRGVWDKVYAARGEDTPGWTTVQTDWANSRDLVERFLTPREQFSAKEEFIKRWLYLREGKGGPLDPLFFASDMQSFAKQPRENIRLLEFKAQPNAKGTQVSSLTEWRTLTGEAVKLSAILKTDPHFYVAKAETLYDLYVVIRDDEDEDGVEKREHWLSAVLKWDETKVTRGKTSENSNAGSFAPKDGSGEIANFAGLVEQAMIEASMPAPSMQEQLKTMPMLLNEHRTRITQERYDYYIESAGLTEPAKAAEEKLKELVSNSWIKINRESIGIIDDIVSDEGSGRMRTQFEVQRSSGYYGPDDRAELENDLFGFPNDTSHNTQQRPVYGILVDKAAFDDGSFDSAAQYGDIQVYLRKEVMERTTFTGGDSLIMSESRRFTPSPMSDPKLYSMIPWEDVASHPGSFILEMDRAKSIHGAVSSYTEAQVHGGVRREDIGHISFPNYLNPATEDPSDDFFSRMQSVQAQRVFSQLDKLGISYSFRSKDEGYKMTGGPKG